MSDTAWDLLKAGLALLLLVIVWGGGLYWLWLVGRAAWKIVHAG